MKPQLTVMLQARMGSSRLPGKVLKDFNGIPVIEHIFRQVNAVTYADLNFILSTSDTPQDDELVRWAKNLGIGVQRSPVDDIVSRLYKTSQLSPSSGVMRIWGDCVFICPDILDMMLKNFFEIKLDFITNAGDTRNLPVGLDAEIYSIPVLQILNSSADMFIREFPFQYVLSHDIKWQAYRHSVSMDVLNLTVDYPEDLTASVKIAALLMRDKKPITFSKILNCYKKNPEYFFGFSKSERQTEFKQKLARWKKQTGHDED